MKISTILRKATEELWDGTREGDSGGTSFTCAAVCNVRAPRNDIAAAIDFLASLGVNPNSGGQFLELESGEPKQGARFLWLDFAALVAEDEGL